MADTMSPTLALHSESPLDKAALAINKLEGHENWHIWSINIKLTLDHTWEYVDRTQTTPPDESKPEYTTWSIADQGARRRIWFALSSKVQETVLCHSRSSAAALYKSLKTQYEQSGTSAEFYARQNYDNAKISEYNQ